jgi:hypothetical protein
MNPELFMAFCLGALTCAMGCMVYNHRRAKVLVRAGVESELCYPKGETAAEIQALAREIAEATNNNLPDVHLLGLRAAWLMIIPDKPEAFYRVRQVVDDSAARDLIIHEVTVKKIPNGPGS